MSLPALSSFLERWATIADLQDVSALVQWDQETGMPSAGAEARGRALATLAALRHRELTDDGLHEALGLADEEVAAAGAPAEETALLHWARREVEKSRCIPARLATALAECESRNLLAWQKARAEKDFSLFADGLAEAVALNRERAACLAPDGRPYDALLDLYEPGVTEADLVPVFAELEEVLVPLLQEVAASGREVDESPARGRFPAEQQRAFAAMVAEAIGFDFEAGRLDPTTHPFCTSIGAGDVRITWRHLEDDFRSALFGVMHEAGHGLYEQGLPARWARTPLHGATGLGMHESQSRLWENQVGRSEPFWEWAMPAFVEAFPDKAGLTPEQLYPALHTCKPTFIRVEADEATYNLHVAARFHIERALFAGEVEAAELPELWDDTYERLLGIRPGDAAEGVLQDIHWAMGAFGYFPTYTLGNLIAAQLFEVAGRELGDLDAAFRAGEFAPLRAWLGERIHDRGRILDTNGLVAEVCGGPIEAGPFLSSLSASLERVYGVRLAVSAEKK